jgi:FkbM family methyltransferase
MLRGLARRFPPLFRPLITLGVRGWLPTAARQHWLFDALACDTCKYKGLPLPKGPYRLHLPPDQLEHYIGWQGYLHYEPLTREVFLAALRPGGVVVDAGANVGYYTLLAAWRVGASGRVHAVEPYPPNVKVVEENIRANGLKNVTLHACAAAAVSGTRTFNVSPVGLTSYDEPVWPEGAKPPEPVALVPAVPLDELIAPPVDLIKMDVDGSEVEALQGMPRLLAGSPRLTLLVEWAPTYLARSGRNPMELLAQVKEAGLAIQFVCDDVAGRNRSLEEVIRDMDKLPLTWGGTLVARRASSQKKPLAA